MGYGHYITFWAASILLILSVMSIGWSLILFFCICDMLVLTGTDLVNAVVLLSGIVMFPTNLFILYSSVNGNPIDYRTKIMCCKLWTCIAWIILINIFGVILCVRTMYDCKETCYGYISYCMKNYRSVAKHKRFIDNLQWLLKCCGVYSYSDWFTQDWHDSIRDYEWDPSSERHNLRQKKETDSVPQSCCKSGSCVSNFLKELGTYSIYTNGCGYSLYRGVLISMSLHLILFLTVIILEILMLKYLYEVNKISINWKGRHINVRQIMAVKKNFTHSSSKSYDDDSDELLIGESNENK